MRQERRTVCYEEELKLEAYRLEGIAQPFPNHFHDYYVIGLIEQGKRELICNHQACVLGPGDMILFNPGDSHACVQQDDGMLDYRAFNISRETMGELTAEITGTRQTPRFTAGAVRDRELACRFRLLHQMVMERSRAFAKEEALLLMLSRLLAAYSQPFAGTLPECRKEVEVVCAYLEEHYMERVSLEQLCRLCGLSKSTLLRAFTKEKGITPYRYLETLRIGQAKKLLEQGWPPVEAALQTGFSDQSHFTNFFSTLIGLTPGAYRDIFENR